MLNKTMKFIRGTILGSFVVPLALSLFTLPVSASGREDDEDEEREHGFCSKTADLLLKACNAEIKDDYWITRSNCLNISDSDDRRECVVEASTERKDGMELCEEQLDARMELCDDLGEDRYYPDFAPEQFVAPWRSVKP